MSSKPRRARGVPRLTRSRDPDALPPALASMWRLCRLGYRHQPRLVIAVVALTLLQAVPDALFALWLMLLARALADRTPPPSS